MIGQIVVAFMGAVGLLTVAAKNIKGNQPASRHTHVTGFTLPDRRLLAKDYRGLRSSLFGILNQGIHLDVDTIEFVVDGGAAHKRAVDEAVLQWQRERRNIALQWITTEPLDGKLIVKFGYTDKPAEFMR